MSRPRLLLSLSAAFACMAASAGCVEVNADAVTSIVAPPLDQFTSVGLLYGHRCGSLDCHGQVGRNLRIYSQYGLRLDPMDVPGGRPTTTDELTADYRSACALEPELMSEVVMDMGAAPDRLTLVRKPRAEESHKGGQLFVIGDPQDTCVTSWLASNVDTTACQNGIADYP